MRNYVDASRELNQAPRILSRVDQISTGAINAPPASPKHLQPTPGISSVARLLTQTRVQREHDASSAMAATRNPSPSAIQYLQRTAGNNAVARLLGGSANPRQGASAPLPGGRIQRAVNKMIYAPGWGGAGDASSSFTFNPHADITTGAKAENRWFMASALEEVEVSPDTHGTVVIHNPFYWHYHEINTTPGMLWGTNTTEKHSYGGPVETSITAAYSVDKEGKVSIGPPLSSGIVGFPSVLDGEVKSDKQEGLNEAHVNINTILKATKTASTGGGTGSESSGGVTIEGTGISGKTNTSQTWGASTTGTGTWMAGFGIVLRVKRKPPNAQTAKISYDRDGKFVSGDEGIDGVNAWWSRIPEPVRKQIKLGKKDVFIDGHASKTGNSTVNVAIAAKRLDDVQRKLVALTPKMNILRENTGSVADERCVVIKVEYTPEEASPP
jgi:hypothetical protein